MKFPKFTLILALLVTFTMLLSACGATAVTTTAAATTASEATTAATTTASAEKVKITFYGKIVEYASGEAMCAALQEKLKDKYDIECVQVDWGNLDKVIRTGIASGAPADVYQYWPQAIGRFATEGMALDLTPYLEANGGEWKKTFIPAALDTGLVDGKYYAVPLNSNFSIIIANQDLLDKAGITIPEKWTWDQFNAVNKQLKAAGIYPFANASDNGRADWLYRNGILSAGKTAGKLEDLSNNKVPGTDPIFATVLDNIKALYKNDYMYPGKGAVTVTNDEIKAGFYQGKVAMMSEIAAGAAATIKDASFKTSIIAWPSMGEQNAVLGGCDGLFIPANAPNKEAAVEILKTYLGTDIQTIHAAAGLPIANANVEIKDPVTKKIVEVSSDVSSKEFGISFSKFSEYTGKVLMADLVLGDGVEAVQKKLEALRQEILNQ
jgi:ABC-type glycerol-3-phosphate transport system substrate-binding protein